MPSTTKRSKQKFNRPKFLDLGNLPFESLNYVIPSEHDASKIKDSLLLAELELERLEANISRTQRRLESLRAQHDDLQTKSEKFRIIVAPYKRLPPEVLRQIFAACLPETVHLPPRPDEAPLLLTRICSSWRALALDTQELWTSFEVALSARPWKNTNALRALCTWLSRCPDRPLYFRVNTAARAPFPLPALRHPILPVDLIIPHTHRIQRLNLQNISGEQMNALITLPIGSFPLLEDLDIFLRDSWLFRMEPWESTAFREARRLRSVSIRGFDGTFNPTALNLPWHQLHTLHLDTLLNDPIGCHALFRHCTSLQDSSVRIMRIEESTSRLLLRLPPTHLLHLRTLNIRFESTAYHDKFMEPFLSPSLRSLHTRFDWRNDPSGTEENITRCYTDLIARSKCPIEHLFIGRNALEMDLERLLELARDLRELTLADHVRVPAIVWERMARGEIGVKLERLGMSVALVDPLLTMLEMRMGIVKDAIITTTVSDDVSVSGIGRDGDAKMERTTRAVNAGVMSRRSFKEMRLGCPKPSFQQKWRMECLEKLGLRIVLCHYGFFEH